MYRADGTMPSHAGENSPYSKRVERAQATIAVRLDRLETTCQTDRTAEYHRHLELQQSCDEIEHELARHNGTDTNGNGHQEVR